MNGLIATWRMVTGPSHAFVDELLRAKRPEILLDRKLRDISGESILEVDDACEILMAAEIVASVCGKPMPDPYLPLSRLSAKKWRASAALRELAIGAMQEFTRCTGNELLQVMPGPGDLTALVEDLIVRLKHGSLEHWIPTSSPARRLRPGDVFRIPLGGGRCAFGRAYKNNYAYIYSSIRRIDDPPPPAGDRDFQFYGIGFLREAGSDEYPVVGNDPLTPEEKSAPLVYNGAGPTTVIAGFCAPYEEPILVTPRQCLGMEDMGSMSMQMVKQQILSGATSLERSIQAFSPYLGPGDIEFAVQALAGRTCRCFDLEENLRFGIVPQGFSGPR